MVVTYSIQGLFGYLWYLQYPGFIWVFMVLRVSRFIWVFMVVTYSIQVYLSIYGSDLQYPGFIWVFMVVTHSIQGLFEYLR
jgi:hypothetical protein